VDLKVGDQPWLHAPGSDGKTHALAELKAIGWSCLVSEGVHRWLNGECNSLRESGV